MNINYYYATFPKGCASMSIRNAKQNQSRHNARDVFHTYMVKQMERFQLIKSSDGQTMAQGRISSPLCFLIMPSEDKYIFN